MKAANLNTSSFDETLVSSAQPVLVDFHAEWCGPCRMLGPVIDRIASDPATNAVVAKVNIDEAPELAARFGITSIPTLIVFKDGQPVASARGAQSESAIRELIFRAA
ncbi:MAG: thioredoxin [Rhizobiaceae bacterium]|nr:thioredoxin [Rhizobiaceae bacterium]